MKWVRVVFTRPRVRNARMVLAAAAARVGWGWGWREGGALITHEPVYLGTRAALSPVITQRLPQPEPPSFQKVGQE